MRVAKHTQKTISENKPFPKLMFNGEDYIIIAHSLDGECTVLHPPTFGSVVCGQKFKVNLSLFKDYDGEITLKN